MKSVISIALSLISACLLVSCGKLPGSPPMIEATSTAIFKYNGQRLTQANAVRCEMVGMNDGVVHIGSAPRIEGDRHWFKRADGSIIIFPEFDSCIDTAAIPGESREVMHPNGVFEPQSHETFVFNSSESPTLVDILAANTFTSPTDQSILQSVILTRADVPLTHNLAIAFPGLAKMAPDPDQPATGVPGGDVFAGNFLGVQARATILASNTKCGTNAVTGVVILSERDACRFVNECNKSARKLVCGKEAGGLHVSYDPSFSTANVVMGKPDLRYRATLYDSRLPVFAKARSSSRKWRPVICVEATCAAPRDADLPTLFYYPARHLLIEVGPTNKIFGAHMFSGRRML